tara:strand:+ start:6694 stop:7170 length:477 start_codon:yes stop_codon:yes gene_type:complete
MEYHGYKVYANGKVLGKRGTFLKHLEHPNKQGTMYWRVQLRVNKKKQYWSIHRLVATLYLPNPNNLPVVDHIDRNPSNNNLSNLRWSSYSGNAINASRHSAKVPYRHINSSKEGHRIRIRRDKKFVFTKRFPLKTLIEEVVRYRNTEVYPMYGIEIDD